MSPGLSEMLLHEWCTSGVREVLTGLVCAPTISGDSNRWRQVGGGLFFVTYNNDEEVG